MKATDLFASPTFTKDDLIASPTASKPIKSLKMPPIKPGFLGKQGKVDDLKEMLELLEGITMLKDNSNNKQGKETDFYFNATAGPKRKSSHPRPELFDLFSY